MPRPPRLTLLDRPGPVRAAFLAAAAASLKLDVGVCGDRARAAAMHALDRGLRAAHAAHEEQHGHR